MLLHYQCACMHALGINSQFCMGDQFWQAGIAICLPNLVPLGDYFWQGGPLLAAEIGPGGPILATKIGPGDQFFLPKLVRGDQFFGGLILV